MVSRAFGWRVLRGLGRGLARLLLFLNYKFLTPIGNRFAVAGMSLLARTATGDEWAATLNGYVGHLGIRVQIEDEALPPADDELLNTYLRSLGENDVKH